MLIIDAIIAENFSTMTNKVNVELVNSVYKSPLGLSTHQKLHLALFAQWWTRDHNPHAKLINFMLSRGFDLSHVIEIDKFRTCKARPIRDEFDVIRVFADTASMNQENYIEWLAYQYIYEQMESHERISTDILRVFKFYFRISSTKLNEVMGLGTNTLGHYEQSEYGFNKKLEVKVRNFWRRHKNNRNEFLDLKLQYHKQRTTDFLLDWLDGQAE